jgi:hypothetical protein
MFCFCRSPSRVERWSPNQRYVAVADPKNNLITVYQTEGLNRTELWKREGWERAFDLADDGEHMVVCYSGLNLLPLNYETGSAMLSFYKRGVVIRKWSLRELIPDLSKLKRTVSHYPGVTALDLTRQVSMRCRLSIEGHSWCNR